MISLIDENEQWFKSECVYLSLLSFFRLDFVLIFCFYLGVLLVCVEKRDSIIKAVHAYIRLALMLYYRGQSSHSTVLYL